MVFLFSVFFYVFWTLFSENNLKMFSPVFCTIQKKKIGDYSPCFQQGFLYVLVFPFLNLIMLLNLKTIRLKPF